MKQLLAKEIRAEFLAFFQSKRHQRMRSSSLIPSNDPSVLLTTAGMQQFKPFFLGEQIPKERRITTSQKCFRTSDIDEVGDATHCTFFEMLGNFSVGDYFKKEAIQFAWELLVDGWGLPRDRLSITVFGGQGPIPPDEEAEELWAAHGVPAKRIHRFGSKDNFWGPPGVTGPCGPCSEIHFDVTETPCERGADCGPNCDCGRFLEIWNLVFMQYNKQDATTFDPLPAKNIDTGMGLERIALVLQNKTDIFSTDLFMPIMEAVGGLCGMAQAQSEGEALQSLRVIADHFRAAVFLVSDGVLPSNEGRGYVLRRILRRTLVHGRKLGRTEPFVRDLLDVVLGMYQDAYPDLAENRSYISRVLGSEEDRFLETLETGIRIFQTERERLESDGQEVFPGPVVFKLYDTFGFPPELTEDMARERGLRVDRQGFEACMKEQREKARASWKGNETGDLAKDGELAGLETEFVGYDRLEAASVLCRLFGNKKGADRDSEGEDAWFRTESVEQGDEALLVVLQTTFYAEGGGQVGDRGWIQGPQGTLTVLDTRYGPGELILHRGRVTQGRLQEGQEVLLRVDADRRTATARNHTATHILHYALRTVLGDHVRQSGSLVAPDRLRFDFTHFAAVNEEETRSIESIVNEKIRENLPTNIRFLDYNKAQEERAIALFGEKYGDEVRMVSTGDFSKELCGGTHVHRTGDIGFFKVVHETSVAAGVRRIEALTGEASVRHVQDLDREYRQVALSLQARPGELVQRLQQIHKQQKTLEKEQRGKTVDHLKTAAKQIAERAEKVDGIYLATGEYEGDANILRKLTDLIRDRLSSGVILLGSRKEDAALLVLSVTKDLTSRFHAGKLVGELAKEVGGKGGGRPDMAQAGGPQPEHMDRAFGRIKDLLKSAGGSTRS